MMGTSGSNLFRLMALALLPPLAPFHAPFLSGSSIAMLVADDADADATAAAAAVGVPDVSDIGVGDVAVGVGVVDVWW